MMTRFLPLAELALLAAAGFLRGPVDADALDLEADDGFLVVTFVGSALAAGFDFALPFGFPLAAAFDFASAFGTTLCSPKADDTI